MALKKGTKVRCIGRSECGVEGCDHYDWHEKHSEFSIDHKKKNWCTTYVKCSDIKMNVRCTSTGK